MRTAAEDAVAVVILAVAGKLARREYWLMMGCCLLLKPPYRQAIGQKIDLLDVVRLLAVSVGTRCALPPEPPLPLFFSIPLCGPLPRMLWRLSFWLKQAGCKPEGRACCRIML